MLLLALQSYKKRNVKESRHLVKNLHTSDLKDDSVSWNCLHFSSRWHVISLSFSLTASHSILRLSSARDRFSQFPSSRDPPRLARLISSLNLLISSPSFLSLLLDLCSASLRDWAIDISVTSSSST